MAVSYTHLDVYKRQCSDNEETISQSKATFAVNVPADLTDATLQNIELTLVNVQTGAKTVLNTCLLYTS